MAGSTTRERASSWPESHHYRPFDKADKTHKECLSLVSLSSKGRAFPPSLLPASVGILMFLSPSPSSSTSSLPHSLSHLSLSLCFFRASRRHTRDPRSLSPPRSFPLSLSLCSPHTRVILLVWLRRCVRRLSPWHHGRDNRCHKLCDRIASTAATTACPDHLSFRRPLGDLRQQSASR